MNKIIKLSESDLINIVKKVLKEQSVIGAPNYGVIGAPNYGVINGKNKQDFSNNNLPSGVVAVQNALMRKGYDVGKKGADGHFGPSTKSAVIKFQKDNRIEQTGNVGPITAKALGVQPLTSATNQKSTTQQGVISKSDTLVSKSTNPSFIKLISPKKINTSSSTPIFPAGQDFCSQFINDFSDKFGYVGDAWIAHNNDKLGNRVFSSFTSLSPEQSKQAIDLWTKINKNGGGKEKGPFTNTVKQFVNQLVPSTPPIKFNLDDIVGIYYPTSGYHEKAFYEAGIPYFTEGPNKNMVPGNTIKSGKGWGMNTHLGIVGAIKNGVPIIFHNIHGQVYADPVGSLKNGGRVAWVRSSGGQAVSLNDKPSKSLEV